MRRLRTIGNDKLLAHRKLQTEFSNSCTDVVLLKHFTDEQLVELLTDPIPLVRRGSSIAAIVRAVCVASKGHGKTIAAARAARTVMNEHHDSLWNRMRAMAKVPLTLFLMLVLVAADKPLTKEETAARDFTFEGVRIGMTEADIVKTLDRLPLSKQPDATGTIKQHLIASESATAIAVFLYRGKIAQVCVAWSDEKTGEAGGIDNLVKRLSGKFGPRHKFVETKTTAALKWNFPAVSREFELEQDDGDGKRVNRLTVLDSVAWSAAQAERKSKIKTGLE